MDCESVILGNFMAIAKSIVNLIWIIGPILAIFGLSLNIIKLARDPDDKKLPKNIKNSVVALFVLFFIPTIINALMAILGDKYDFSACWNKKYNFNRSSSYIEPHSRGKKNSLISNPNDYEKGKAKESGGVDISSTACGSLQYCNKFMSVLYSKSIELDKTIRSNNASVIYSNNGDPQSWDEAINVAKSGGTVKISCNRPAHWGMREITGEYRDFWSKAAGGFINYKGPMTQYTKQLTFDGSKSVKTAIQDGTIIPGDIIGTTGHTFVIYTVNRNDGSALVFDGGHKYTGKCQKERKCAPINNYTSGINAGYKLYQIIRWVK